MSLSSAKMAERLANRAAPAGVSRPVALRAPSRETPAEEQTFHLLCPHWYSNKQSQREATSILTQGELVKVIDTGHARFAPQICKYANMHISTVAVAPMGIAQRQLWVCVDLFPLLLSWPVHMDVRHRLPNFAWCYIFYNSLHFASVSPQIHFRDIRSKMPHLLRDDRQGI